MPIFESFTINSFPELVTHFERYRAEWHWLFRGHATASYKLLPKAGRPEYQVTPPAGSTTPVEEEVFNYWRTRAVEFMDGNGISDLEWLAVAQHHGLATRLLDWSMNPLIAAYFAVKDSLDEDAFIYALLLKNEIHRDQAKKIDPFKTSSVSIYRPTSVAARVIRQRGIFTLHDPPTQELKNGLTNHDELHTITITKDFRKTLQLILAYYGFNEANLFPDLDGLSSACNWGWIRRHEWTK